MKAKMLSQLRTLGSDEHWIIELPAAAAKAAGLRPGQPVQCRLHEGKLLLETQPPPPQPQEPQPQASQPPGPSLLRRFSQLVLASNACKQRRTNQRLRWHMLAMIVIFNKNLITGLLRTAGRQFVDWTADHRLYHRVQPHKLFDTVRAGARALMGPDRPFLVALDASHFRKCGRTIPATRWLRDPLGPRFQDNLIWGQRFLQTSALVRCGADAAGSGERVYRGPMRALPLDLQIMPTIGRLKSDASQQQRKRYNQRKRRLSITRHAAHGLRALQAKLQAEDPGRQSICVVDGQFTNGTIIKRLPDGMTVIGRIRQDAKFHALPAPGSHKSTRYGPRLPTPEQLRRDESVPYKQARAWAAGKMRTFKVKVLEKVRWRPAGGTVVLKMVVISPLGYRLRKGSKLLYRKPAYLICTDPQMEVGEILQAYIARWEQEVAFRDEKTVVGVGEAQVHSRESVKNVPAVQVAAYSMMHLAAMLEAGPTGRFQTLPPPAWYPHQAERSSTNGLINQMRYELWGGQLGISEGFWSQSQEATESPEPLSDPVHAMLYAMAG